MNNDEYIRYSETKSKVPAAAKEYIDAVRGSDPARSVGINARSNVVSADVSAKMGTTITVESHAERSIALQLENDRDVIEYWEQPCSIEIRKINRRGSRIKTQYTADFLVLRPSGPEIIEVKTRDEAERLVETDPKNWIKKGDQFHYIPAEQAYQSEYNLSFKVVVVDRLALQIAENIRILHASRDQGQYPPTLGLRVMELLSEHPLWRLDELKTEIAAQDYLSVIQMIDRGRLAFDLASASLACPDQCYVASNSAFLELGVSRKTDIENKILSGDLVGAVSIDLLPGKEISKRILKRLERIASGEDSSSVRRWKKQIKEGVLKGLTPFQSLVDMDKNIKGRSSKLAKDVKEFLDHFINDVVITMRTESKLQIYYEYLAQAKEAHPSESPVSNQTFYMNLGKLSPELIGEIKGGKRMSLAMSSPSDPKKRHIFPTLPWLKVSVDHYKVDLNLIVFEDGKSIYVARPWLSTMIDVATSEVLAFSISFQDPSRRSCAKLIRECVRRHGKLPREILVDHGSDFTSIYFRSLLANYRVTHSLRPASNPRYGSEVERFFGEFKQQWLSQRPGFVEGIRTLRAIDGGKTPDKAAVLTIEDLYLELNDFLIWRSSKPRGASSVSSSMMYEEALSLYPFIPINVGYDDQFILATCVESSDYKIDYQRGIHIRDLHYHSPKLKELNGRSRVEVRIDPENPYVVFVLINGQWHPAYNTGFNRYVESSVQSRIADGIRVFECSSIRRKINTEKGVELANIRHSYDQKLEKRIKNKEDENKSHKNRNSEVDNPIENDDVFVPRSISSEDW